MVDALKKLDKKFLIIAGCILILPVVFIVFLVLIQGCSNRKMSYSNYEKKMLSAAEKYFKDKLPMNESEEIIVTLDKLVTDGYIKDPNKAVKEDCTGQVSVRRNGASIDTNDGGFLNYIVKLNCDNYSTVTFNDKITSNVVESDSGLYKIGDEYIFRGSKLKNHFSFFGHDYRIMSIDKDGIIKLIKSEPESASRYWDNKFNVESNASTGKTIYKDSAILSYLIADYQNPKRINKAARGHIVAYDACIGKRESTDYRISREIDCSEILEKQVISLINVSDFAMASTDPDCKTTHDRPCKNYNYLSLVAPSTWTLNAISENSYGALLVSDGLQSSQNANLYNEYNIVIYIDGNEAYTSGDGSEKNPYLMK